MPRRFVILTHDHPFLHWDLMLEDEADLRTWRLLAEPDSTPDPIPAEQLPRHRKAYLDYEGPLSGDRGRVARWDVGEYSILIDDGNRLLIQLIGDRLQGRFDLVSADNSPPNWKFNRRIN